VTPAVRVDRVSKRYQLGVRAPIGGSFREMLVNAAKAPFRRMRHLSGGARDGWFWALRDISFAVAPGEITAIVGANGAGKSTLLKVLSRITEPTSGRVEMHGRVASLLEVGTGFHPELTGRENVFLNGAILGMRRAEIRRKFDEIVDFAEVATFIDTPVKHYSSGMYLRLAFSVAAHLDGEILLVDEVLAVGDVAFQQKCLGKMQDVGRGGRSVLFVTHNMAAAGTLCERGILVEAGRIRLDAPVQETIKTYLSDAVSSSSRLWDADNLTRSEGRGELLRFTRIEACPTHPGGFRFGEALRFRVHVRSNLTRASVFAGAGIDDILGHRLATFDSDLVGFSVNVEQGREYDFELHIPQPYLNPGRYFLSVSLLSGQTYFDLLFHVAAFDVTPIRSDTGDYFEPTAGAGALRLPFLWTHASNAYDEVAAAPATRRIP
jgi:lipopolysaccharide transport system ATP-binding protein